MISTYPYSVIDNGVFEINEFDGSSMFLIAGDERALLVDAGVGIGDLKTFIGGLTDRPIDVLLTHNHRDHVGNAPRYSAVHMGKGDIGMGSILRNTTSRESRIIMVPRNETKAFQMNLQYIHGRKAGGSLGVRTLLARSSVLLK